MKLRYLAVVVFYLTIWVFHVWAAEPLLPQEPLTDRELEMRQQLVETQLKNLELQFQLLLQQRKEILEEIEKRKAVAKK